ncbi:hypothetical protein [Pararcticibacter amylolyticus]|uniref:Uncharacterized protein n=1 Tax=Pararcticibacter amylolyticus TaxID=2173175 RepID=A0A2U2P993_9SPHI|nr:hypothetical protein [Pararcticibacter amylolyticus]PWG77952.1 hypothetical protein DDR33_24790 [Pararcticibacter amylolyticus]
MKTAIRDYGYNYNNRTGGSRPNGKDATIFGTGLGGFWVGASYKLNAVYDTKTGLFTKELVIGIGAIGILGGEITLNSDGSFKGATLGIDLNSSILIIYGAEATFKAGWKWGK